MNFLVWAANSLVNVMIRVCYVSIIVVHGCGMLRSLYIYPHVERGGYALLCVEYYLTCELEATIESRGARLHYIYNNKQSSSLYFVVFIIYILLIFPVSLHLDILLMMECM